jgi:integrase
MSIEKTNGGEWRVRWRENGRNRSKVLGRKRDAEAFDAEVRRRKRTGEIATLDAGKQTVAEFAREWWTVYAEPNLAPKTREVYVSLWDTHCLPRVGHLRLRDLTAESCQRFAADMAAAGVGPASRRKALALLGSIVQRAVEWGRIPTNPVRTVRLPAARPAREVRPLAPATVEAMRAVCGPRDATLISILAYAGLRPQEALAIRWRDVGERTLTVYAAKTGRRRSVRLLAPLASDLREWRLACGRPSADALVIPGHDGAGWTTEAYKGWSRKAARGRKRNGKRAGNPGPFARAAIAAGAPDATPYTLRHSFCSLLVHEGRSVIYVARQLGHGAQLTLETYGHVIDELDDAPRLDAETAIRQAREQGGTRLVPTPTVEAGA